MLNAGSLTVNRKNVDQVRGKPRPSADIKIAVTFGGRQYSISALLRYGGLLGKNTVVKWLI